MIFANDDLLPISLNSLSLELISGLPADLGDPLVRNGPWTKAVKEGLRSIGKRRNLSVFCHGSKDQGEWLLDLVWMTSDWSIVLAVESEWGNLKAIQEDFGKLMSIKARYKLLLFATINHVGADRIVDAITSLMLLYPYHLAGEQYMAIEVTAQGAFRYSFQVSCDGRLESVQFNQMGPTPVPWPWAT